MNLVRMTTLAFAAAVEARLSTPHDLRGADQLSFLATHCEGCEPDYCYPKYEAPDYECYKTGYPKCCTKTKGNCPNDVAHKPDCECLPGVCANSDSGTRSERCVRGDGTCKGNTFCQATDGACGELEGRCQEMPAKCGKILLPVCGCNGVTYANECEARAVGVNVAADYACESAPVDSADDCTLDGNECGSNNFCAADAGQCLLKMARVPGKCQPFRPMCNLSLDPVCGCDMETYDNADCANAKGVNVAHRGKCMRASCTYNGVNHDDCSGDDEFCRIGEGDCKKRIASQPGYCAARPLGCPYDYKPVCGCDLNTYANECVARSEGVNVMHEGEC